MKKTNRLLLRCKAKEGAGLAVYYTWECGDGCCSERARSDDNDGFSFGDTVQIDPEKHTWNGVDVDGFWVVMEDWTILEIPKGYIAVRQGGHSIIRHLSKFKFK